jgi:hypothetical protein
LGNLKEKKFENLVLGSRIILKLILNKLDGRAQTGLVWLRIGAISRLL